MCGRYALTDTKHFKKRFKLLNNLEGIAPRYNVAPGSMMPVVVKKENTTAEVMRWGLVPFWAKDPKIGYRMINARAESLRGKPTWKKPFLESRCLIPASGFFEWQHQNGRQPYYITVKDQPIIAFAGLASTWLDAENHPLKTFAIITTTANEVMSKLHDRMPVIISESDECRWLDPENQNVDDLQKLLRPYASEEMALYPVTTAVNSPKNDDVSLLKDIV